MNLNMSQETRERPPDYKLVDPPKERTIPARQTYINTTKVGVLFVGALISALYILFFQPVAARQENPEVARYNEVRREIETGYSAFDAALAEKEFPAKVIAYNYQEIDQSGEAVDRRNMQSKLDGVLKAMYRVMSTSKAKEVSLADADTAIVSAAVETDYVAPFKLYSTQSDAQETDAKIVMHTTRSYLDRWKREGGSWMIEKRSYISGSPTHIRMVEDTEGTPPKQEEGTPEIGSDLVPQFTTLYGIMDEQRTRKQFPDEMYTTDWEATDAKGKKISLKVAKKLFQERLGNTRSVVTFSTTVSEATPLDTSSAVVNVTLRVTFAKEDGSLIATGTRRETDHWTQVQSEGSWRLSKTRHKSNSPILAASGI